MESWRRERAGESGPLGLADLARHAAALSEALTALAVSESGRRGQTVSCARGCASCCREVVPVSPAEACLLADWMEASDWDRQAEIGEAFRRARKTLGEAGLSESPLLDLAAGYFGLGLPCPFLSGEECAAHPVRPMACRGHLVSSPPSECGGFPNPSIRIVAVAGDAGEALSQVAGELLGGREMIPLVRLPDWIAANSGLRGRVWEAAPLLDRLASACLARLS